MKTKALCIAILLLLSLSCLFAGCTKVDIGKSDETSADTGTSNTPVDPGVVYGKWYSTQNQTVIDILEEPPMATFYQLKIGYYEYQSKVSGSYTYEDHILTMTSEDGKNYSWIFDTKTGVLTANMNSDTSTYSRCDSLPTEFIAVPFPNLSELVEDSSLTIGKHTELSYGADCKGEAAISIFSSYYEKNTNLVRPTLTNRVAERGDYVNIDYTGYLDGVAFEGGAAKAQDIPLIENSGYIPGFAEGVIGQTAGATFDVPVTFPADYHSKELAGKEVIFKMTLNKIYDLTIPDEAIQTFTDNKHTTYQSLLEETQKTYIKSDLWQQVIKESSYKDTPESIYGYFFAYYRDMYHYYAALYGMNYELFMSYNGITDEMIVEQAKNDALEYIVAMTLAKQNELAYTQQELDEKIEERIKALLDSGIGSRDEAVKLVNENELLEIKANLTLNCVKDWIYTQNVAQ